MLYLLQHHACTTNYSQPSQIVSDAGSNGAVIVPLLFACSVAASCAAFIAASIALSFSSKVMSSVMIVDAFIPVPFFLHVSYAYGYYTLYIASQATKCHIFCVVEFSSSFPIGEIYTSISSDFGRKLPCFCANAT